ncbi:SH2 domain-containing protein 2A [Bagarius yarrelli]|uniref:SH2 domain-containing protein 2A n=1 Tax=Bagarius yarrelli TaxID=175774 RepID=A0A556U8R6_BAGYA|nr:SH2 domain-containing protein 2A [Bagarius yarrelli]
MDFDYQKSKDEESHQREVRLRSLPVLQPKPLPRLVTATEGPSGKPPIKPRRSIKCRAAIQAEAGQPHSQANQIENVERKRIAPSQVLNPSASLDAQTPLLQAHNLLWFQRTQLPRLAKPVPRWLHGFATRREAEKLLQDKQQGCFLLRLSESTVGFVLSYRGADKCRHFIIDEQLDASGKEGCYIIAGENSKHRSLEELINYYTQNPVGPFDETLTVPCIQHDGTCENETKLEIRNYLEKDEENVATPPCSGQSSSSISATIDFCAAQEPVQYTVVKKPLGQSLSLSECHPECDMMQLIQENTTKDTENTTAEPAISNTGICVGEDVTHPVDAPYARVKKPQRPAQHAPIDPTDACTWGASAATESQSLSDAAAVAEQKYCALETVHLYEEALNTCDNFYAVGRREENQRGADFPANHVYSEVNIKGVRDDPTSASPPPWTGTAFNNTQSSSRPIPRPPPRSVLQHAYDPIRVESSTQSKKLLAENSDFSIYEQIPERPNKSRPPFPQLIPKRY